MDNLNVSVLGYGMMGVIRSLAYRGVVGYFKNAPIQPVLGYASCWNDGEKAMAERDGWKAIVGPDASKEVIAKADTDYVDICLPNAAHYAAAMAAFDAGKHVFCEKPLSANLEQGREMADKADAHKELLNSVNFIYRRVPANVFARKLARSGKFGRLIEARMFYNQGWGWGADGSWRFEKSHGGGAAGDLGSHSLDMLYYITGLRPIELCAMQTTHVKQRKWKKTFASQLSNMGAGAQAQDEFEIRDCDVDDAMRVMFTLDDNSAIGTLSVTRNACGSENQNGYELRFEKGTIKFCFDEMNYLEVFDKTAEDPQLWGWSKICTNRAVYGNYFDFADGHMIGYRDITVYGILENLRAIDAIKKGAAYESESPIATFRDAYNVQRTLAACDKSIAERCWVKLEDIK